MIEGEPSRTALIVAAARAAHLRFDAPPHLLEDVCAEALLGAHAESMIEMHADGANWILLENRLFLPLRARYAEDRLRDAYRAGVRQLVVLGAGLDSYAFRQPVGQEELTIFEVDHPNTQLWKADRIASLGWSTPENFSWVACDFETTSVSDALDTTSFDERKATVVTWLGVIYYLKPETAHAALVELRNRLAPGSEIILDFLYPWDDLPARYQALRPAIGGYLKGAGEPQVNRYRPSEIRESILDAGFSEALIETPKTIADRYHNGLAPGIPLSERFGFAVARVNE